LRCYQVAPRQQLVSVINKSESETRKRKWGCRDVSRAIFLLAAGGGTRSYDEVKRPGSIGDYDRDPQKIARWRNNDGCDGDGIMNARFATLRARALCHRPRSIDVSRNKPVIIYKEATKRCVLQSSVL